LKKRKRNRKKLDSEASFKQNLLQVNTALKLQVEKMKEEINYIRKNYIIEKKEYKKITLIQKQELENLEVLNNHLQASENTDKIIQRCLMRIKLLVEDNEIIRKNSTILENEIKDLKKR